MIGKRNPNIVDNEDRRKSHNKSLKILMPSLEGAYVKKEEFINF